mgnify:CR=1 FL=1
MKRIEKGDLVFGLKPWNKFAKLGVVISEPIITKMEPLVKHKVFWYAPEPSPDFETKRTFVLEELSDSIQRMESDKNVGLQDRL